MMVIISYDVDFTETQGAKRLRKVAKICERYGVRVQNSVFETIVDSVQLTALNLLLFVKPFLKDFQHTSFQHKGMTNKAE